MAVRKKSSPNSTRKKMKRGAKTIVSPKSKEVDFPIVGIGASAGGLKALEGFFRSMPPDSNMAFVVVQHLDPTHESIIDTILAKCTRMKVLRAKNEMVIEPNHVYVNPPARI